MNFNFTIPRANKLFIFIKIQPIINFYSSDKINQVELGEKKAEKLFIILKLFGQSEAEKIRRRRK